MLQTAVSEKPAKAARYRKPSGKPGAPSTFSPDIAVLICEELAQGKSLRTICKAPDMPSLASVFMWLANEQMFADQYARAMEMRTNAMLEEIFDLADRATPETANVVRVQIDARKWAMSKMAPKKYGDKLVHSGDDANPIKVEHTAVLSKLDQRLSRLAAPTIEHDVTETSSAAQDLQAIDITPKDEG